MMPDQFVLDRLTSFYRAIDVAIPDRSPTWRPDTRRPAAAGWRIQLLATAALLLLSVAVGFLIHQARLNQGPTPGTHGVGSGLPSLISLIEPVQPMGFPDRQHGWVVSGNRLLQTADGGRTWHDASPPGTTSSCCAVFFLNAQHGWAGGAYTSTSRMLQLFKTTDGGTTWKWVGEAGPTSSPNPCCPTVSFVDDQHGWLMYQDLVRGATAAIGRLLRTTDGGATWSSLPDLPSPPATHPGGVLPEATLVGFVSTSKGWYVGYNSGGNEALYITLDRGQSWAEQEVPVPASGQLANRHLTIPAFPNGKEGVLPVTLDDRTVLLEFSNDGGATWHMDAARAPLLHRPSAAQTAGQYELAPSFIGNGVVAVVLGNQIELNTGNGWTSIVPRGIPGVILDIQFANARLAWALTTQGPCQPQICNSNDVVLMKTTDGGQTWTRVGS